MVNATKVQLILGTYKKKKSFAETGRFLGYTRQYISEVVKKYYVDNNNTVAYQSSRHSEYAHRTRMKALMILGGKCKKCGFKDWRALQIDHKNGGGTQAKKTKPLYKLYRDIINGIDLEKYQVLCANCNWIKRHLKKEFNNCVNIKKGESVIVTQNEAIVLV